MPVPDRSEVILVVQKLQRKAEDRKKSRTSELMSTVLAQRPRAAAGDHLLHLPNTKIFQEHNLARDAKPGARRGSEYALARQQLHTAQDPRATHGSSSAARASTCCPNSVKRPASRLTKDQVQQRLEGPSHTMPIKTRNQALAHTHDIPAPSKNLEPGRLFSPDPPAAAKTQGPGSHFE